MKPSSILITLLFATIAFGGHPALAQTRNTCGLMVMAHGGGDEWNAAVTAAVRPLENEIPTSIAFGMANPRTMKAAVAKLEAHKVPCIVVVRLFMSAHSFLHQTEYLLGLNAEPPPFFISHGGHDEDHGSMPAPLELQAKVLISREALLDAPEMGHVLAENALAMTDSSGMESVLILAHGAGDDGVNAEWLQKLDHLTNTVRATGLFRAVSVQSLREDWKEKRAKSEKEIRSFVETHSRNDGRVLVIPFRLYGFGPYEKVLQGLSYSSTGKGLLPSPQVTEWIRRTARDLVVQANESIDSDS